MLILLIDDDVEFCDLLGTYFVQEGFDVEAMHRFDADDWTVRSRRVDFVVLDVGLPGMSGFDVLRHLRADSRVPVLMLTARGDDVDRIVGLELGADDYVPKPCNPRELAARVRAILRRVEPARDKVKERRCLRICGIELDPGMRTVTRNGMLLPLTSTEFNVLEVLMRNAGSAVSKEELTRDVLGRRMQAFDRAIDMHISSIRRKIGEDLVRTVRGMGYQFLLKS